MKYNKISFDFVAFYNKGIDYENPGVAIRRVNGVAGPNRGTSGLKIVIHHKISRRVQKSWPKYQLL